MTAGVASGAHQCREIAAWMGHDGRDTGDYALVCDRHKALAEEHCQIVEPYPPERIMWCDVGSAEGIKDA